MVLEKNQGRQGHPARPSSCRVVIQPPGIQVKEPDKEAEKGEGMTDNSDLQSTTKLPL